MLSLFNLLKLTSPFKSLVFISNLFNFTTGDDAIDEIEDTPLAAIDMITNENDALRKFIQGAVSPFGIEVDVQVNRDHNILTQMIRKYKNPAFDVTKPLNVQFHGAGGQGLDAGGITREYFYFLVESMKQCAPDGITLLEVRRCFGSSCT